MYEVKEEMKCISVRAWISGKVSDEGVGGFAPSGSQFGLRGQTGKTKRNTTPINEDVNI